MINSNMSSVMKWLIKLSGTCAVLYLGLSNYTIIANTDKESRLFQIASFFMPYIFYIGCASLSIWGLLFVYQKRNDINFRELATSTLKKTVLYIFLPSIAITAVIIAVAIGNGQLDLSKTPFW